MESDSKEAGESPRSDASPVHESQSMLLENIVLRTDDLAKLAALVEDAIQRTMAAEANGSLKYTVTAEGGREYTTSRRASLTGADGILERAKVTRFEVRFFSMGKDDSSISVQIQHGAAWRTSQIVVAGNDAHWVSGTMRRCEDFVAGVQRQRVLTRGHRMLLALLSALACLSLGTASFFLFFRLDDPVKSGDSYDFGALTFIGALMAAVLISSGFVLHGWVTDNIGRLWPNIELQTGQEWQQEEAAGRRRWSQILTVLIAPTLISVFVGILLLAPALF